MLIKKNILVAFLFSIIFLAGCQSNTNKTQKSDSMQAKSGRKSMNEHFALCNDYSLFWMDENTGVEWTELKKGFEETKNELQRFEYTELGWKQTDIITLLYVNNKEIFLEKNVGFSNTEIWKIPIDRIKGVTQVNVYKKEKLFTIGGIRCLYANDKYICYITDAMQYKEYDRNRKTERSIDNYSSRVYTAYSDVTDPRFWGRSIEEDIIILRGQDGSVFVHEIGSECVKKISSPDPGFNMLMVSGNSKFFYLRSQREKSKKKIALSDIYMFDCNTRKASIFLSAERLRSCYSQNNDVAASIKKLCIDNGKLYIFLRNGKKEKVSVYACSVEKKEELIYKKEMSEFVSSSFALDLFDGQCFIEYCEDTNPDYTIFSYDIIKGKSRVIDGNSPILKYMDID